MRTRRPLVTGNWKMNGLRSASAELLALKEWVDGQGSALIADVMICPPATLIVPFAALAAGCPVAIGAQDCHVKATGAFTGDISAAMLADAGATAVILGHSERRAGHGERDSDIKAKAQAAHDAGLMAIICIGETAGERRFGLALDVVSRQLRASLPQTAAAVNTVIAYEPVWAIGTGLTPTLTEIAEIHGVIRRGLEAILGLAVAAETRILYGGSVKPTNAAEIFRTSDVDGALVGGASLKTADFSAILSAYAGA